MVREQRDFARSSRDINERLWQLTEEQYALAMKMYHSRKEGLEAYRRLWQITEEQLRTERDKFWVERFVALHWSPTWARYFIQSFDWPLRGAVARYLLSEDVGKHEALDYDDRRIIDDMLKLIRFGFELEAAPYDYGDH
jgi:hypothetical protein